MLEFVKVLGLFAITALAEIIGCYLPWLVLTQQRPVWLLPGYLRCTQVPPGESTLPTGVSTWRLP